MGKERLSDVSPSTAWAVVIDDVLLTPTHNNCVPPQPVAALIELIMLNQDIDELPLFDAGHDITCLVIGYCIIFEDAATRAQVAPPARPTPWPMSTRQIIHIG